MTDLDKHSKDADVYAAMRTAALDFGIDELAAKMHTAIGTLYNKLNRNDSSAHHKPTVSDLLEKEQNRRNPATPQSAGNDRPDVQLGGGPLPAPG